MSDQGGFSTFADTRANGEVAPTADIRSERRIRQLVEISTQIVLDTRYAPAYPQGINKIMDREDCRDD